MSRNVYPLMGRAVGPLLVLSLVSNLAILISPLFMMQLLDRVIPSGNMATLLLLAGLAFAALALQAVVEASRDLSLGRLSRWSEGHGTQMALAPNIEDQNKVISHVAGFTSFLSGPAVMALLGAPWLPLLLFVLWMLHPAFVVLVVGLTLLLWSVKATTRALSLASKSQAAFCAEQEAKTLQTAQDLKARVGVSVLIQNVRMRFVHFQTQRHRHIDQSEVSDVTSQTASTFLRSAGQISALGLGGWLVTADLMSAGGMIAGSIITSKAYMTIETLMAQFHNIRAARSDYLALIALQPEAEQNAITMDTLTGGLRAENVIFPRGGGAPPRLDRVSFALKPGECLAIVGGSGSGKSTLLQALCGITPAPIGSVFFDENDLRSFNDNALFEATGYLPQRAELNIGTIAESISSFDPNPNPEAVIEAAKTAGVHGLICALPEGFETNLEQHPYLLSAGQAQRVALARAIYTKPKYLFLDEPNALLDAEGERALGQTLMRLKDQGTTIVMVLHRSGIMSLADKVLRLEHGRVTDFGNKIEVLNRWGLGGRQIDLPLLETSLADLEDWIGSQFTREGDDVLRHKTQILGSDLLSMACDHRAQDTLSFVKFSFNFLDDARCELIMDQAAELEVEEQLASARTKSQQTSGNLVHLTDNEVRLVRIVQISEQVVTNSKEDMTQLRVIVADTDRAEASNSQKRKAS